MRVMSASPGVRLIVPILVACVVACGDSSPDRDTDRPANAAPPTHAWAVTAHGAGAIRVGMTLAEAAAASPAQLAAKRDWSECTYLKPAPGPDGLTLMVLDGRIARVDVTAPEIPTAEGIRVGDTEARVRDVYGPANVSISPHKYTSGRYLTIAPDQDSRLVFETDGVRVTRYRGGRLPEVEWVEGCG